MQRITLTSATIDSAINRKNCAKLRKKTQEHRKPSNKPATPPETTAFPAENQTSERTQTPPNKSRVKSRKTSLPRSKTQTNSIKREFTERISSKQRTMVAPAHNHAENFENLQELTLWMGAGCLACIILASFTSSGGLVRLGKVTRRCPLTRRGSPNGAVLMAFS